MKQLPTHLAKATECLHRAKSTSEDLDNQLSEFQNPFMRCEQIKKYLFEISGIIANSQTKLQSFQQVLFFFPFFLSFPFASRPLPPFLFSLCFSSFSPLPSPFPPFSLLLLLPPLPSSFSPLFLSSSLPPTSSPFLLLSSPFLLLSYLLPLPLSLLSLPPLLFSIPFVFSLFSSSSFSFSPAPSFRSSPLMNICNIDWLCSCLMSHSIQQNFI